MITKKTQPRATTSEIKHICEVCKKPIEGYDSPYFDKYKLTHVECKEMKR